MLVELSVVEQRYAAVLEVVRDDVPVAEVGALVGCGREEWDHDRTRRLAVERLLEIIGEAARALSDEGRSRYPGVPWQDVIGSRSRDLTLSPAVALTAHLGVPRGTMRPHGR